MYTYKRNAVLHDVCLFGCCLVGSGDNLMKNKIRSESRKS